MIFYKDKFRYLRESQKLTLKDVANALGVSEGTVQKWEKRANFQPRTKKIEKIAHVLKCNVSDLCNLYDPIPEDTPFYLDKKLDYIVTNWDKLKSSQKNKIVEIYNEMIFDNKKEKLNNL